jgi:hypothetical protein
MTTIYLSSTYEDLKEYREVVYKALRQSGYEVIAMEDYVAADNRPVDKCLADVRSVDIYIGIFAFRYGYIPPESHGNPEKLSITELEFRAAESLTKPCLTFVVNESTPWRASFMDSRKAEDKGERINSFRQYLLAEKMASSFSSPHELSTLVLAAITKQQAAKPKNHEATKQNEAVKQTVTWDIKKDGSPCPGLMHFTRKYARVFFGREAEVNDILDRMRRAGGPLHCHQRRLRNRQVFASRCRCTSETRRERPTRHGNVCVQAHGAEPRLSSFRCPPAGSTRGG